MNTYLAFSFLNSTITLNILFLQNRVLNCWVLVVRGSNITQPQTPKPAFTYCDLEANFSSKNNPTVTRY